MKSNAHKSKTSAIQEPVIELNELKTDDGLDQFQDLKKGFQPKQIKTFIAGLFLFLLIAGSATAMYLTQLSQDLRNQASVVYGACPAGVGGSAANLNCNSLANVGLQCVGYESCHLPSGYDSCDPLPGTNTCLYAYQGGQCTGPCPANMGSDVIRCQCSNGQWTIGKGASCDQLCACSGNDCPTCRPTDPPRNPSPTSSICQPGANCPPATPSPTITRVPTPSRRPSVTVTPTRTPTPSRIPSPTVTPTPTLVVCRNNVDIALVFDRSSTMNAREFDGRKKLIWAKEAATAFVQDLQNSGNTNVRISVSSFGAQGNDGTGSLASDYNSKLHIGLSSDYEAVKAAISGVNYVRAGTCIVCGIRIGNQSLSWTTYPKYEILLSDGKANKNWDGTSASSGSNPKRNAINEANLGRQNGITYFVMGYGYGEGEIDEVTLRSIAGSSANYTYRPDVTDWAKSFRDTLAQICR